MKMVGHNLFRKIIKRVLFKDFNKITKNIIVQITNETEKKTFK